jgi:hypothetical protein
LLFNLAAVNHALADLAACEKATAGGEGPAATKSQEYMDESTNSVRRGRDRAQT